jgi:hypothetical protein
MTARELGHGFFLSVSMQRVARCILYDTKSIGSRAGACRLAWSH